MIPSPLLNNLPLAGTDYGTGGGNTYENVLVNADILIAEQASEVVIDQEIKEVIIVQCGGCDD